VVNEQACLRAGARHPVRTAVKGGSGVRSTSATVTQLSMPGSRGAPRRARGMEGSARILVSLGLDGLE
jgi:hypothetical protein